MRRAALALAVVALALCGACSSAPSEAEQLCSQLDAGTPPVTAIAALPGGQQDPAGTATRARDAIRSTCPQHEQAAAGLDAVLNPSASAPVLPTADEALRACTSMGRSERECRRSLGQADEPAAAEPTTTRRQQRSNDGDEQGQAERKSSGSRVGDPGDDGFVEQCVAAGRGRQECVEANQQGGG